MNPPLETLPMSKLTLPQLERRLFAAASDARHDEILQVLVNEVRTA